MSRAGGTRTFEDEDDEEAARAIVAAAAGGSSSNNNVLMSNTSQNDVNKTLGVESRNNVAESRVLVTESPLR
jgi:hypothetical protein